LAPLRDNGQSNTQYDAVLNTTDTSLTLPPTPQHIAEARANLPRRKKTFENKKTSKALNMVLKKVSAISKWQKHTKPKRPPPGEQEHSLLYRTLSGHCKQWYARVYRVFISIIILYNLFLFIMGTDDDASQKYKQFFYISEAVTSSIFLVDYIVRLYVITEKTYYRNYSWKQCFDDGKDANRNSNTTDTSCHILGRLRYMVTIPAIIDAISTFPFFIELMTNSDMPTLTFVRALVLFRILKTERYFHTIEGASRVFYYNREVLFMAFSICCMLVVTTSFLVYYTGPGEILDGADFSSIPNTMYLAILMLTGEWAPTTPELAWYSKLVQAITCLLSVGIFAIPASMITWGFEAEAGRLAARAKIRAEAAKKGEILEDSSSGDPGSSTDSDWEEYDQIVSEAGGYHNDDHETEEEKFMQEWRTEINGKFEAQDAALRSHMKNTDDKLDKQAQQLNKMQMDLAVFMQEWARINNSKVAQDLSRQMDPRLK